jgi:hypothetical protein
MDTIKFVTASNYTVEILPALNYGQFLEIQKVIQSGMSVDAETKVIAGLNGDMIFKANQKALEILLVKLSGPDGTELANPSEAIKEIPINDGIEINDKIQEIWTVAIAPKKKAIE